MRKVYQSENVVIYSPFWRSVKNGRQGYVIEIDGERYPKRPDLIVGIDGMRKYFKGKGMETASEKIISDLKARMRRSGRSGLHNSDVVTLMMEEVEAAERLTEESAQMIQSMENRRIEERDISEIKFREEMEEALKQMEIYEVTVGTKNEQIEYLRHALSQISGVLEAIKGDELDAAIDSLSYLIPPVSKKRPQDKYKETKHHKTRGYKRFRERLCEIKYIDTIESERISSQNNTDPIRISNGHVLVYYRSDIPVEFTVETTAKDPTQQEFVAAYIRHKLFDK